MHPLRTFDDCDVDGHDGPDVVAENSLDWRLVFALEELGGASRQVDRTRGDCYRHRTRAFGVYSPVCSISIEFYNY